MKNKKTHKIVILVLALVLILLIGYKAINQYEKEKTYEEWAESDIGSAILYAIEGSSYKTAGGEIASVSGILFYTLEGRGNCIEVTNRMNEYVRLNPANEVLANRRMNIAFISDWPPYQMTCMFTNYLDGYDDAHKEIDVVYITSATAPNGYIDSDCVVVPKNQNSNISYLVYDDNVPFKNMVSSVEGCTNLFPKLKKVYTGYTKESEEYIKLSEEFHKYLPDCIVE